MNDAVADYVIEAIYNSQSLPSRENIHTYLIEPCAHLGSGVAIHHHMTGLLTDVIGAGKAVDAYIIFELIWWDLSDSEAQRTFDLARSMTPLGDTMGDYTHGMLVGSMVSRFPTLVA